MPDTDPDDDEDRGSPKLRRLLAIVRQVVQIVLVVSEVYSTWR